jgi:hypothetical protein
MTWQGDEGHHVDRKPLRLITGRTADFAELAGAGTPRTTPLRRRPGSKASEPSVAPPMRQQEEPVWT